MRAEIHGEAGSGLPLDVAAQGGEGRVLMKHREGRILTLRNLKHAAEHGATTRAIGSTAIMSIAFNCSVAFISPISAVIAEPARLANSSAAITGPSSRSSDSATITPTASAEP